MIGYRFARPLVRLAISVFFRQVEVVGLEHICSERDGPVILVGSHSNSMIDPALIMASTPRIVRFAAKDTLFQVPVVGSILRMMGVVPLARRSDHPKELLDNRAAFETLRGVLAAGGAMGIFPEGLSHEHSQLQRLRTGTARIVLGVAAQHQELGPRIIPCGLIYVHRKHFRSRVLVQFGPPIEITPERVLEARTDERGAVRRLTDEIDASLRALTVNGTDWETVRFLDSVRRLYQPSVVSLRERAELARRFNLVYPAVKDEPEITELCKRIGGYLDRLKELRLSDRDLKSRVPPSERFLRIARHLLLVLVWLPLAIPGLVVHAPVGLLAVPASKWLAPRKDVTATTKLVSGIIVCTLLYVALVLVALATLGWPWALAVVAALPVTGHAVLVVIDRGASIRAHAVTLMRLLSLGQEVEILRRERDSLEAVVRRVVNRLRPPDMEPLFLQEEPGCLGHRSGTVGSGARKSRE